MSSSSEPGERQSPIAPGDFKSDLLEKLKEFDYAVGYLLACMREGDDVFRQGLMNVLEAQKLVDTP